MQQDILELQLVAGEFERTDFMPDYDLDCSGAVDVADIQAVAAAWGTQGRLPL